MKQRRQICALFILIILLISLGAPEAAVNKRRRAKSAAKHLAKRLAKAQLQKSKKASKASKVTTQMNYAAAVSICHAKLKSLPDGADLRQIRHVAAAMAATTGLSYEQTATACMAAKQQLQPTTPMVGAGLQQAKAFHHLQQPRQQQQQQQLQLNTVGDLAYVATQPSSKVTWRQTDIGEVLVP